MSNYTGGPSTDSDYNVDEAESWSSRPEREQREYESFRRRAEIARRKRAMTERYELVDEDLEELEDEYVPEHSRRATKLLNKPDELPVEEYIRLFNLNELCRTRYSCPETLEKLGLLEDVEHLFQSCHLDTLMSYPYVAYEDETIQLLSSLQVEIYQGMTADELESEGLGFITFSVYGQSYMLTIQRLEGLFGFPSGTGTKQRFDRGELKDLWFTIGSTATLNSSRSKSNQIRNPVIRYFQRSVAHVLYSIEATGTVTNTDMEMISMALRGTLHQTKNGVVTPILIACGVPITSKGYAPKVMDFEHLHHCEFLEYAMVGDKYRYRFEHPTDKKANIILLCPELTRIIEGYNIGFEPAVDDLPWLAAPLPAQQCHRNSLLRTCPRGDMTSLSQASTGLSLVSMTSHMSLRGIHHTSLGNTRGERRLHLFVPTAQRGLCAPGDNSTAVLDTTKEERSSTNRKEELKHDRKTLQGPGTSHRRGLMITCALTSIEVSTTIHHCQIPSSVYFVSVMFLS
ncbi:hypothetical protein ISN44_As13g007560 [Arabidopsis suecica]|uniref:Arabidopsis retrotransposon Orf1 C-terminal domain-containing protein n=1 Tax=Arabidopsis suecica TaxID=45249 RepID=A0A8T1XY51_ARASU|nr:hypothetical protein ISN44_As13g007560 [Arabidopsis suecica]